jgi:hypothetical protein
VSALVQHVGQADQRLWASRIAGGQRVGMVDEVAGQFPEWPSRRYTGGLQHYRDTVVA